MDRDSNKLFVTSVTHPFLNIKGTLNSFIYTTNDQLFALVVETPRFIFNLVRNDHVTPYSQ